MKSSQSEPSTLDIWRMIVSAPVEDYKVIFTNDYWLMVSVAIMVTILGPPLKLAKRWAGDG